MRARPGPSSEPIVTVTDAVIPVVAGGETALGPYSLDLRPGEVASIAVSYTHLTLPTTPYV